MGECGVCQGTEPEGIVTHRKFEQRARLFFLLCLWFEFHDKDNGEPLNDLQSGNNVMALMLLLVGMKGAQKDAVELTGRLVRVGAWSDD